jgi:hypothetical protein
VLLFSHSSTDPDIQGIEKGVAMAREQKVKSKASQPAKQAVNASARPAATPVIQNKTSIETAVKVQWPGWPTSKPGPQKTPPPPGMRPINALRPEQETEIGYNQETGEPGVYDSARSLPNEAKTGPVSFDQQESLRKQRKRS